MTIATRKHLIYWILPSVLVITFIIFYYFNIFDLANIISPEYNREFGVVENLQLLIIIGIIYVSVRSLSMAKSILEKFVFGGIVLLSLFIFLEEMDYGLHIYDHFSGKSIENIQEAKLDKSQVRNLHNQGHYSNIILWGVYISYVLIILALPVVLKKKKYSNKYLEWIIPSRYLAYALIAMAIVNRIALNFDKTLDHSNMSLSKNVSEFEEIFIYYIALLYLYELAKKDFPFKSKKV